MVYFKYALLFIGSNWFHYVAIKTVCSAFDRQSKESYLIEWSISGVAR